MTLLKLMLAVVCGACVLRLSHGQRPTYSQKGQEYYDEPSSAPQRPFNRPPPQESAPKPAPVAILKQINKHNEDGSYTYGYEGGDGSFKIETKLANGEVMGKYGYVDDSGKVRVVEYGANKYGFMPSGEGITVAPPTLVDETVDKNGNKIPQDYDESPRPVVKSSRKPVAQPAPAQYDDYQEEQYEQPAPKPQPRPQPRPQARPVFAPAPVHTQHVPQSPSFDSFEQHFGPSQPISQPNRQYYEAPRQTFASVPQPRPAPSSLGPVPPRPQIPGASPAPVYEEQSAPRPAPARIPVPQRAPTGRSFGGGGILDQLAKDYALPSGGAGANVDITFSSY